MLQKWLLVIFAVLPLMGMAKNAKAGIGPEQVIRRAGEDIRVILKEKAGLQSENQQKEKLKKIVNNFLDFQELSRVSLGPHWKDRTHTEQKEFTNLLRDLIESSYKDAIRENIDFRLEIEEEEIPPSTGRATVFATASSHTKEGKEVSEDLTFHLYLTNRKWMVFDIEFGDVSLVRHYSGEFNRKIKKESYTALLETMKEKLKDIHTGKVKNIDKF